MSTSVQINNARILSYQLDIPLGSVRWAGNTLVEISASATMSSAPAGTHHIDAAGCTVIPGLIDIHTHGASGADVCDGSVESLRIMAEAKLREGVTTFLPTTLTLPHQQLLAAARAVASYQKEPTGAKAPALHIEGPFINPKCAGAQNPDFVRPPDVHEISALREIHPVGIVSLAAEMPGALEFIAQMKALCITTSLAHTAATAAQYRQARQAGLSHLTHFGNQMTPLHHREIGIVGSGLRDRDVMIELITDGIHLVPEMVELVFALKAAQGSLGQLMIITDSMAASHLGDGQFSIGGLPVTVADGQARLDTGALAGSTLQMHRALHHIMQWTGLPPADLIGCAGFHQAQSLSQAVPALGQTARLQPGFAADVAMLTAQGDVHSVFVDGVLKWQA